MRPPELHVAPDWNRFIDELAEQAVDDWIEQKHAHEIVVTDDPEELI